MKSKLYFLLVLVVLFVAGCIDPPSYPNEPRIEFKSISKSVVGELYDSVYITISFEDGDGDIGVDDDVTFPIPSCDTFSNQDDIDSCRNVYLAACRCDSSCFFGDPTRTIFVIDSRTGCNTDFMVESIPPKGSIDDISGEITVLKFGPCCIAGGFACIPGTSPEPFDTIIYSIVLRDRAGNLSNWIETPPIVIDCSF